MARTKTGRPRCEKARKAVLGAADELLRENGPGGLTVESVAARAKVGKPTIYRWWPALADIVLETMLRRAKAEVPVPDHATLKDGLRQFLRLSVDSLSGDVADHLRFLMAQAQRDEDFRARFREKFVAERRGALRSIFLLAARRGQARPGLDPDIPVDLVFGAMWYRLLTGHAPLDRAFADQLADAALAVAGPVDA
jgi:AcrR family transcriptional regulator